jgi:hypothetical protein
MNKEIFSSVWPLPAFAIYLPRKRAAQHLNSTRYVFPPCLCFWNGVSVQISPGSSSTVSLASACESQVHITPHFNWLSPSRDLDFFISFCSKILLRTRSC